MGFLSFGVRYFCLLGLTNFATCLLLFANFQVRLFLGCYFGLTYFAVTNFYLQIFGCILYCLLGLTDFHHLFVFMTVVVETFSSYILCRCFFYNIFRSLITYSNAGDYISVKTPRVLICNCLSRRIPPDKAISTNQT